MTSSGGPDEHIHEGRWIVYSGTSMLDGKEKCEDIEDSHIADAASALLRRDLPGMRGRQECGM
jgi:hypothetical protein